MNFMPPDFTKDVSFSNRNMSQNNKGHLGHYNNLNKYPSPLLATKFEKPAASSVQNRSNSANYNSTLHNRLGHKNYYKNNNLPENSKANNDRSDKADNRHFNRKRFGDASASSGIPNKKWRNNKRFYQNSANNNSSNSAQSRMNRIRGNNQQAESSRTVEIDNGSSVEAEVSNFNDSQDFDATDITVEVVNHNVQPIEDAGIQRFKMELNAKTQAAIQVIQQKRREKQIIFPFPVTPNVTGISLNERFALL